MMCPQTGSLKAEALCMQVSAVWRNLVHTQAAQLDETKDLIKPMAVLSISVQQESRAFRIWLLQQEKTCGKC